MDQLKIGKFIAECRKKENLTQMQLAEKLNITDRAVSKWETGKAIPYPSCYGKMEAAHRYRPARSQGRKDFCSQGRYCGDFGV